MKKVLSLVLVFAMLLSTCVTAIATQIPSTAKGIFTLSTASTSYFVGDTVDVTISFRSTDAIQALGIAEFKYNSDALEFVDFSAYDEGIKSDMMMHVPPDTANMAITIMLSSSKKYDSDVKICTMTFKVKDNAPEGTYQISAASTIDSDDTLGYVVPAEIAVSKKSIEGLSFEGAEFTYDGTAKALAVTGAPADATVSYESADFDADGKAIDAGTYNIKATVKKDGYKDWTKEAVLKINPKTISVTGLAAESKVYDGTNIAALTGGELSGLVARDAADQYCEEHSCYRIKCAIPFEGTFADANAGNNKAVTVPTITLDGCSKDNYVVTQPIGLKANITKAPITITADNKTKKVGQNDPELTYTVNGNLASGDAITGKLERAAGEEVKKYDITIGTLAINDNYDITFNKGIFEIFDRTVQNVLVDGVVTEKTYGDDGFKITVTPDRVSNLNNFNITSSNTNVAEIDANGNVTIKNAGATTISVKQAGNAEYAPFEKTWTLTVKKLPITITADNKTKKIGQNDPQLTYTLNGNLVNGDAITGKLERAAGEEVKKYDITIGTLAINDNYDITFNKGIFEIFDRTVQNVLVDGVVTEKTYGDDGFKITVTPDGASNLNNFDITSSNTNVAEIDANGNVTIKNAGATTISVKQAGNAEYAPFEKTWTLAVKKLPITITAENKTKKIGQNDPELTYVLTGALIGEDVVTGALERAAGEEIGVYDINIGSLAINDNYEITFNKGVFEILDKTPQNVLVDGVVTEKTYGDDGFKVTVTPDAESRLDNFTFASSDTNVAEIAIDGTVTIKNAGTTTISVVEAGNAEYAPFEKAWTLTVNKVAVTITADNKAKKIGQNDPELTYVLTGSLIGEDVVTGALERAAGEEIGVYDINIGSLAINDNYEITFNKGVFEILDKTPQVITIEEVGEKTYGDEPFALVVTADSVSGLDTYTYTTNNADVADVAADGVVTINSVGNATITVYQAGNEEYAATQATIEIVVNPAAATITAVDIDNKTATIEGILASDTADVELDFDSIKTTVISSEKTIVDGVAVITSTVKVTNFVLKGEKAENYTVDKDASLTTTVVTEAISDNLTPDENVTVNAAPVDDKTIIVTDVVVNPEAEVQKVTVDTTAIADSKVNTVAMPANSIDAIIKAHEDAVLEIILKDGSAENKTSTISLNKAALNTVYASVYASVYEQGIAVPTVSISVDHTPRAELESAQQTIFDTVSTKTPVVYTLNIVDSLGNSLISQGMGGFGNGGFATVKLPYAKPAGSGNVIVKHLDDFGTLTNVANPIYDVAAQLVSITLGHFSDYLIYTEPVVSLGGGGGIVKYTVKFESNGGSAVKSVSVNKNAVVAEPATPAKEGFKFDGWYTDKELTTAYDFTTKVTKNITLYAKWTEIETEEPEVTTKLTFKDIAETDWFYNNVKFVVDNKLMNGIDADFFAPNATLTRAMLVTILYRNEGEPATNRSIPFADVDMGSWYANAVSWAKQNGIVNGVNDVDFAPDSYITREQIATIMFRYAQYKGMDAITMEENLHFADANEISEYAVSAMNWAVGKGLMKGRTETTINPKDNATRAEIAAVLQRFIEAK